MNSTERRKSSPKKISSEKLNFERPKFSSTQWSFEWNRTTEFEEWVSISIPPFRSLCIWIYDMFTHKTNVSHLLTFCFSCCTVAQLRTYNPHFSFNLIWRHDDNHVLSVYLVSTWTPVAANCTIPYSVAVVVVVVVVVTWCKVSEMEIHSAWHKYLMRYLVAVQI